jgi:hypothetical protein
MTDDPTLAALLRDPAPDVRLIAADYAADRGDELVEAVCRSLAVGIDMGYGYGLAFHVGRYRYHLCWLSRIRTSSEANGTLAVWDIHGRLRWDYSLSRGWGAYRTSHLWDREPLATPPSALEAAVLAVLRARLAEVRHG